MSTNLRKLRIAFSVLCGIVCLLLIVMWVRSYWWADEMEGNISQSTRFVICSSCGAVELYLSPNETNPVSTIFTSTAIEDLKGLILYRRNELAKSGFRFEIFGTGRKVSICPYWFLVLLFAVFAVVPWLPLSPKFSLSTLLIAITMLPQFWGHLWSIQRGARRSPPLMLEISAIQTKDCVRME